MTDTKQSGLALAARPPRQARSRASLERMLDAAEGLLDDRYFHELRIEEIARRANVSIGSLYCRFPNKDAILIALYERYKQELSELIPDAEIRSAEGKPLRPRVAVLVKWLLERSRRRRGLLRALIMEVRLHPERYQAQGSQLSCAAMRFFEGYLLPNRDEITHRDPVTAIRMACFAASCVLREKVVFSIAPFGSTLAVNLEELELELNRLMIGYLTYAE